MPEKITIPPTPEGLEQAFQEIVSEDYSRYYELWDEIKKAWVYELAMARYKRTGEKLPKDLRKWCIEEFNLSDSQVQRSVYDTKKKKRKREESEDILQMEMCFNGS